MINNKQYQCMIMEWKGTFFTLFWLKKLLSENQNQNQSDNFLLNWIN